MRALKSGNLTGKEGWRWMRTYLFQITDGERLYTDKEDAPFLSAFAALQVGRTAAWALMCDLSGAVQDWSRWRIEVTDETGRTRVIMPFVSMLRDTAYRQATAHQDAKTWG